MVVMLQPYESILYLCDTISNMQEKMEDPEYTNDIQSLLNPGI